MRTHCENWNSSRVEFLTDRRTGKTIGRLMPQASQAVLEASPGVQSWSRPDGKASVMMYDMHSVVLFAEHWERKWARTYPFSA